MAAVSPDTLEYHDFVGEVQHRLELGTMGEAVRATRAVLTTLGERLQPDEAANLAGPLPMEVDRFLLEADSGQRFGYEEFVDRVAERAETEAADAAYYARVVVALVAETVPAGEFEDVRSQLPADYDDLFELVDEREK